MTPDNTKRLVLLSPGFAKNEEDSTCLPFHQSLVLDIKERFPGIELIICALQYPYHKQPYKWNGIQVIPFNGRNKGGLNRLWTRRTVLKKLSGLHEQKQIDGLLSFWYGECAAIGKKFGQSMHILHYCWMLGQDARMGNKYPRRVRLKSNELIALSNALRMEMERNYGLTPDHVIEPGIDERIAAQQLPHKDIDIIAAGSLLPVKQFDLFLKVVMQIKDTIPGLKCKLVGEGPMKNELLVLIRKLGLADQVEMTGALPHDQVMKLMERSRLLLHTSAYEGFGLVMPEALAAGASVCSFVDPKNRPVENWFIVHNEAEMVAKANAILKQDLPAYRSIPFRLSDTSRKLAGLFFPGMQEGF